mgnify:CR=1 FL=1
MRNFRSIRNTKSKVFDRSPHQTDVETPSPAVGINFRFRGGRVNQALDSLWILFCRFCKFINCPLNGRVSQHLLADIGRSYFLVDLQVSRSVLKRHASANRNLVSDLPSEIRIDVKRQNRGLDAALILSPIAVIVRAHPERHRQRKADPGRIIDLMRNEAVGNGLRMEAAVGGRAVVARVVKIEADADKARLDLRARMKGHRSGVVIHAANVGAVNADAGVGAAHGAGGLFGQHKARSMGGSTQRRRLTANAAAAILKVVEELTMSP